MKLLTRINRNFLLTSVILLTVCSLVFYFLVQQVIYANADEDLLDEKENIIQTFNKTGQLPYSAYFAGDRIEVHKTEPSLKINEQLTDTMMYSAIDRDIVPYRQLSFFLSAKDRRYVVSVAISRLDADDFATTILVFVLIFIAALFIVQYFINRNASKKIWLPFNDTVSKLRSFDVTGRKKIHFTHSDITEFEELNRSLNKMTEKIYSDYNHLKQFTENASHEIQTPLSIILSKIETIIQNEDLSEEQMSSLQKINEAATRLSKLNTALLTLTKIENQQFSDSEDINLASFLKKKISDLEEFTQQKKLAVSLKADESAKIKMNTALADLLFSNLIGNAIKHNIETPCLQDSVGFIHISVQQHKFIISNSGKTLHVEPEKLFERFVKNDQSSDSLGLGLAMVKQICKSYGFNIELTYDDNVYSIQIIF